MPHPRGLIATDLGPALPSHSGPAAPNGRTHPHSRRTPAAQHYPRRRGTNPVRSAHPALPASGAKTQFATAQRGTEPPAGLADTPQPPPWTRWDTAPALPPARWPIAAAIALGMVMLLGAAGAVVLARYQSGGPLRGQLVNSSGLSYRVPGDWTPVPGGPATSVNGVALDGVAAGPRYSCGGHDRVRATVGSTFLIRRDGGDARAEDAARDFGPLFAKSFYGRNSTVTVSAPIPTTVGAVTGAASLVTVRAADQDGCPGLYGQLRVLALPSTRVGQTGGHGVLMLVLQHDAGGGGARAPAPVAERTMAEILSSVQVSER